MKTLFLSVGLVAIVEIVPGSAQTFYGGSRGTTLINVTNYGAKCDGNTDDTAAFSRATTDAAALGNVTLRFPAGICKGNLTLPTKASIEGAGGPGYSSCVTDSSCPTVLKDASGGTTAVITLASGANGNSIRNVALEGTGSGTGDRGIYASNANETVIENVGCNNFGKECVRWEAGAGMRIVHSFAQNTLLTRQTSSYSGSVYFGGTDGFISDSEFTPSINSHEGHSLSTNCYNTGLYIPGTNNFIVNTYGETAEIGVYIGGAQNRVVNSRGDLNYCQGLVLAGGGNTITNFLSLRNGQDGSGWEGVKVTGLNNTIANSIVDQSSTSATLTNGFTDANVGDANYNIFSGNLYIGTSTTSPLYSFASTKGAAFTLPDKDVVTIPDGTAQPDVNGHTLFLFAQTTPININTLKNGISGQRVCFAGNSNVTLQSSGNIYLGGSSSETMQVNRLYCFRDVQNFWSIENTPYNPIFGTLTAQTEIIAPFVVGGRAAPSAVAGSALGTGGAVTVSGTAFAGYIQFNTGSSGTAAGTAATLTFPGTYPFPFKCVFSPGNVQGGDGITKLYFNASGGTNNATVVVSANAALPASEALGYMYLCGL